MSRRSRKSTSLPPRPRSLIITAISRSQQCRTFRGGIDHHACEPRRQRQQPQPPAFVGDAAVGVERAEFGEQRLGLGQGCVRRRIEERELFRRASPSGKIEREGREIGGEDFRLSIGFERGGLRLIPEPVTDARLGTAGAAATLIGCRARDPHGFEPGEPDIRLVPRYTGKPAVDDDARRPRW